MLTPFPELLAFSFFIPAFLRITVAAVFVYLLLTHFKHKKTVADELHTKFRWLSHEVAVWLALLLILAEAALATGLFLGAWTQIVAILGAAGFVKMAALKKKFPAYAPLSALAYVLLAIICLSLLISGAGAFAFDLPL